MSKHGFTSEALRHLAVMATEHIKTPHGQATIAAGAGMVVAAAPVVASAVIAVGTVAAGAAIGAGVIWGMCKVGEWIDDLS